MSHIRLICGRCGAYYPAGMATLACADCNVPLDVDYMTGQGDGGTRAEWAGYSIPLPLHGGLSANSLGEGGTPVVELPAVGRRLGLRSLHGKLEFMSPTGSFKDRGVAVMMAAALELGVAEVVEDSSGNAGASVSAYAARAGIKAHVFAPATAPEAKVGQIRVYSAEVHSIEGSRDDTTDAAVAFYKAHGLVYASHAWSPYFLEGTKTFAYEVAAHFEGRAPDHIVFPVGNGGLYLGAWKGFRELRQAGHISVAPRLHAVQSRGVMPLVAAFNGEDWSKTSVRSTVAGGIAVAAPARKLQVLDALRDTGGVAVAVDDPEILEMQRLLAAGEGVFAEPTSAAAFAGLERLVADGVIGGDDLTLVAITGFGLKDEMPG